MIRLDRLQDSSEPMHRQEQATKPSTVALPISVPTTLVVGRGLKDGVLEVRDRRSGDSRDIARDQVVEELQSEMSKAVQPESAEGR